MGQRNNFSCHVMLAALGVVFSIFCIPHFASAQDSPLIVGTEMGYPPYSFLDENGKAAGYNVDLTKAIAAAMHLEVEIKIRPWGEIRQALESGEIDAIVGMYYSLERDKLVDFSPAFASIRHAIFIHQGSPAINSEEDLQGKSIIVMQGDIMHDYVLENRLTENLVTAATLADALRLLAQGQYDCALIGRFQGAYWVHELGLSNIEMTGPALNLSQYCFAVKEGNQSLQSDFAEGLTLLTTTGLEKEIYDHWLGVLEHDPLSKTALAKYLLMGGGPVALLLLIFVVRASKLRNQVAVHSQDLQERTKELQCIYSVAALIIKTETIEDLLQNISALIPLGWKFPEITRASIVYDDQAYYSENFTPSKWFQSGEIMIAGQCMGRIEVYYMEKRPELDEGPFARAERHLITAISQLVSEAINAKLNHVKFLDKENSFQQLFQKMLNGFAVHEIIYDEQGHAVDYRFEDVNPAFEKLTGLTAESVVGKTVLEVLPDTEKLWIERYGKVASTGIPDFFENYAQELGKHFEVTAYSPSPNKFACIFADVTERKEFQESLAHHRDRLQSLAFRLANAEELLRQDIAAGLHDSIGQDLAALKLNVDIMNLRKGSGNVLTGDKAEKALDQISEAINEVVQKIWSLSFQLCPPGLFKAGFIPTMEWLIEQFNSQHDIKFILIVENELAKMSKQSRGVLFQMVRELMVNAVKHAQPTEIKIVMEMEEGNLLASVIDNGCGFDVLTAMTTTDSTGGFGLFSIKERLAFLSGKLKIESDRKKGTRIMITYPLNGTDPFEIGV